VGTNNINAIFQPLRNSRRSNVECYNPLSLCGSCLNSDAGIQKIDNPTWYVAGGDLKIIISGPGYGRVVSTGYNYDGAATQKR